MGISNSIVSWCAVKLPGGEGYGVWKLPYRSYRSYRTYTLSFQPPLARRSLWAKAATLNPAWRDAADRRRRQPLYLHLLKQVGI